MTRGLFNVFRGSESLDAALDDLSVVLAVRFLHMEKDDRTAVIAALSKDHDVESRRPVVAKGM